MIFVSDPDHSTMVEISHPSKGGTLTHNFWMPTGGYITVTESAIEIRTAQDEVQHTLPLHPGSGSLGHWYVGQYQRDRYSNLPAPMHCEYWMLWNPS